MLLGRELFIPRKEIFTKEETSDWCLPCGGISVIHGVYGLGIETG
jgi:hypothetical protein